jgi:hypothetical protein
MRPLAVCVALAFGCHGRAPSRVELANVAQQDAGPVPEVGREFEPRLAMLAVTDGNFYRSVLYTWTSPAQISELRQSHVLLTATTATGGFVSPFLRELALVATDAGPGRDLAHLLLDDPRLSRRRYAWPAPFATSLGLGARTYGTSLIRIALRDDAWIGRFEPAAADPFTFVDASNAYVSTTEVLAHPDRIGAIFHVRHERGAAIREYVICNPAMISSWSVATPEIRDAVDQDLAMLAAIARVQRPQPSWLPDWHASLAFDTARYQPTPRALADMTSALRAYDPAGDPLSYP